MQLEENNLKQKDKENKLMPMNFLATALLLISIVTSLTVEGLKKVLDGTKIKYSSNVLAVIASVVISLGTSVVYLILNDIVFNVKVGAQIFVLMYLGFLVATVGYDKVAQLFDQITGIKKG